MNCLKVLEEKGFNLNGYSLDTIVTLQESEGDFDECESLLWYLESIYG